MNDRARFDVLVAPRVGSVIEAQQQAFAMPRKELKCVIIWSASGLLATPRWPEWKLSCLRLGGAPRLWRSSSDSLVLVRRRR
jgi:hypothetical protein